MNTQLAVVCIALAVMIFMVYCLPQCREPRPAARAMAAPPAAQAVTVYGSKTCPWCVKQEEYLTVKGVAYDFVDCAGGVCPDFVKGFPTLVVDGEVKEGYTEL
jgi:hypothetical protein